jgi:hypothetical protein
MEPDLVLTFVVTLGFILLLILILRLLGSLVSARRKLLASICRNAQLENENQSLRRQVEEDRNLDRAKRGDYGTVYEGSYKEIYQSKKTGQWFASREVTVDP